ncbi:helix-turn-helix transcriptional regulator [Pedobacter sp. D749]|uniref:helix-turn-helix domain-containing protein n=1 Tax=Pedobacter sp. D749 TaxID=2856523 RepID=UPI001C57AC3D|nr:helix-turn-helix transcriptional regulator [Pedobacter sp. D749]QXU43586.1 helix-turn-helix domain-containing protein [Pedobacter sp. D749]
MSSNYMTILNNIKAFANYIFIGSEMILEKEKIIVKRLGHHLKPLKETQKISYRKFHKRSGVNTGDVIKYENGETSPSFIIIKVTSPLNMPPCKTTHRITQFFMRFIAYFGFSGKT